MNFSISLCLGLFSLFLGSSLGSIFCIVAAKIFKKKYLKCRFSLFCITISISVIFATIFIVFFQQKYDFIQLLQNFSDLKFLLIIFALGIFLTSFLRTLFPISLVLYCAIFFHSKMLLNKEFGENKTISLTVQSRDEQNSICVYKIHSKFLLPINRFYFKLYSETESKSEIQNDNFFQKMVFKFNKWLLSDIEIQKLRIPTAKIYPVSYILKLNQDFDNFNISITRTL